ncbi:MAG: nucleoside monophosphate kinase [Candidatus Latescibacteria bacterium]|nr:nucleoside monophosphate kinase [Candidatus Latescibacterota bacterium]
MANETPQTTARHEDLEIKDAGLIFSRVWANLTARYGEAKLHFPKEIIWLGGAPGSGKGTNTPYILEARGITAPPLVVSSLLDTSEARRIKDAGGLVGDEAVAELLFEALLKPVYATGVVVDGFPRTKVQVECLKLFFDKLNRLHDNGDETFTKPLFHCVLLFIDEEESIQRQLRRGEEAQEHNRKVASSGVGQRMEIRATDLDAEAARGRYRLFKETTFEALQSLRQIFHFHFIDAEASLEEVQEKIEEEFLYQSSLELDQTTFTRIQRIPEASQVILHARQALVTRLDDYNTHQPELFQQVVAEIESKFVPIIRRYAITGRTLVNSEDRLFEDPDALAMLIDIFSERGYQALVDINLVDIPTHFDIQTGTITCTTKRVYRFEIRFTPTPIRRGHT